MKIYPFIKLAAILIMVSGLCACQQDPVESTPQGKKTILLRLSMSDLAQVTRAVDDNMVEDLNIYFYNGSQLDYHAYLTDITSIIPIEFDPYGNMYYYDVYVVANMHYDMGDDLTVDDLHDITTPQTIGETLPMKGYIYLDVQGIVPGLPIPIQLERSVSKINYNITLASGTADGIDITSVEFRSIPLVTNLISGNNPAPTTAASYHDIPVFSAPGGSRDAIEGVLYMPDNPQGVNSAITDQKQKNAANAPKFASYILIRAQKDNKLIAYYIYLGENNTSSFNVKANQEHTMNINIINDSEVDTRITSYAIDVYDDWTEEYNVCDGEVGLYTYIVGHNLVPGARLTARIEALDLGSNLTWYIEGDDRWYPSDDLGYPSTSGETTWQMELNPFGEILTADNNFLRYRVTIFDGIGATFTKTLERRFANKITAYFTPAAGRVEVTNALRKVPAATSGAITTVAGVCLEDGCTFTAVPEVGYAFDGWYSDQACTALLSTNAQYRHRPRSALDKIYTKWNITTSYTFDINCSESNKNSTYMFNTNNVSIKSGDYTGNITVEINNLSGGVLATQQSYPLNITAGQTLAVGAVKFVPTQIGEVAYSIVVKNSAGIPIASRTVTNTAVATKLTPSIEIGYGSGVFGAYYNYNGTSRSWSGYENVSVRVAFSPTLDYPAPLDGKELLEVKLKPQCQTFELIEQESVGNPGVMEPGYLYRSDQYPLSNVVAQHANNIDQSKYYIAISAKSIDEYNSNPTLFRPYTAGDEPLNRLILPSTSIEAMNAKMMDRTFVKFTMSIRPYLSEIQLESRLSGIALRVDTNIDNINYTNKLF